MSEPTDPMNAVTLVGRVSAAPETREMPSGDLLVTFRLVVDRPASQRSSRPGGPERQRRQVDVLDIACWSKRTQRSAATLESDTTVRVEGALRRRFFRAGGGASSRYEVEAERVARLRA